MKFDNEPNFCIKDQDGKDHWISRSVATVVTIILNDEKVLLVKRGPKISESGKWCSPCGYLDRGENATLCAIREVWEETGFDISEVYINEGISYGPDSKLKPIIESKFVSLSYPWDIVTDPKLNHNQDIALYFGISIKMDKEPTLTNKNCDEGEIDDVKWVDIKDISNYEFAFNHDKRIVKFLNHMKNDRR
jgi:8-oxo-dGTP pyrophosphatase MutT (NUDIX family)